MVARLIAFAKSDNPQIAGRAIWHPATDGCLPTMVFDRETEEKVDFDKELIKELAIFFIETNPLYFLFSSTSGMELK